MEKFLSQQFSTLDWLKDQDVALVGVGGSARNVARIHQSEHTYPISGVHNYTMSDKDIDEVYDIIRKSSRDELNNLDGLSRIVQILFFRQCQYLRHFIKNRCKAIHIFKKWLT